MRRATLFAMRIDAAGQTDIGRKRTQNEDTFVADGSLGLYGVCDGMGGHLAGEVAAAVALEALTRTIRHRPWVLENTEAPVQTLVDLLDRAVTVANTDVHTLAGENIDYDGMGCTVTMLLVSGDRAALTSVGDSRAYRIRDGAAHQLTVDHTMGQEMMDMGAMTPEEVAHFRYARLLSRAVGIESAVRTDSAAVRLAPGDRFVICTDGLSDYIESEAWLAAEAGSGKPAEVAQRLVTFANEAGGRDNITVVVGHVR